MTSVTILIPAKNEERAIRKTVQSCLDQTVPASIVVVNDGSTDGTGEILAEFGDRICVITIPTPTGNKSYAQQRGLQDIHTDVVIMTDADTIIDRRFVEYVMPHFNDPSVMAVAGYVKSLKNNWITACREIEYTIGQDIHKTAQGHMNFLYVIPGCAGAFRRHLFDKELLFEHDTLTEDLDLSFQLNEKYLKIVYEKRAVVYTQDPFSIKSYANQLRRWYSGGWQNVKKHLGKIMGHPLAAVELTLMYVEGTVFSILLFIMPFISLRFFGRFLLSAFGVVLIFGAYAAIRRRRIDLLYYSPCMLIIIFVNSAIFVEQLFKELIIRKRLTVWIIPERKIDK